jgi:hypothetical protein
MISATKILSGRIEQFGAKLFVIGDRKGPEGYDLVSTEFYSIGDQNKLGFEINRELPLDHYGRKNLGYLKAFTEGMALIYETDDDNYPLPRWIRRLGEVEAIPVNQSKWVNAYQYFSCENIWPRGFPLDEINISKGRSLADSEPSITVYSPIQQGLANGSPDVDAIWRLVLDKSVEFEDRPSIWLPPGSWCPFNSQSTWWWPEAYPLMYLPSHCSFRMTDIWRSFIAQRCLWELGYGVVFHTAEVFQERNEHNLMRDFSDEISGYLRNKELVQILSGLILEAGTGAQGQNLLACYRALVAEDFFPRDELKLVEAWLDDLAELRVEGASEA